MPCMSASIVFSQSYLNVTGPMSATTIYTPTADGVYRIGMYVQSLNGDTVAGQVNYASYGAHTLVQDTGSGETPTTNCNSAFTFMQPSGVAIPISTSCIAAANYNLYVVLEQLA